MVTFRYGARESSQTPKLAARNWREAIKERYGEKFLPSSPRFYKNKAKNAQEAHECIRPTSISKDSKQLKLSDPDQFKLYDLIWKRTISCQMESAKLERTSVDIQSPDKEVTLRANGQVVLFEGFLKVYEESNDDTDQSDSEGRLPQMSQGENIDKLSIGSSIYSDRWTLANACLIFRPPL